MLEDFEESKDVKLGALAETVRSAYEDIGFATFAELLFRHAAGEDLARYTVQDLMALAEAAWHALQHRTPGEPRVVVMAPADAPRASDQAPEVSIVEVVNDDKPFLFGSTKNELQSFGLDIRLVVHPILAVERNAAGKLVAFHGEARADDGLNHESFVHVHVEPIDEPEIRENLVNALVEVQHEVSSAVDDWPKMRATIAEAIERYRVSPPPIEPALLQEAIDFLEEVERGTFIFTGMREYALDGTPESGELVAEGGGLGILRNPSVKVLRRGSELVTMTPEVREFLKKPEPIIIGKANVKSRIHRRVHLDYIGVKHFENGVLCGELRVVGLFTSAYYTRAVSNIPMLRRKAKRVLDYLGRDPESHSGNALVNIIETYPRDELFQIDEALLAKFALAILQLDERPRVRVLPRIDPFDRFVSLIVYVPRDRFTTHVREAIEDLLHRAYEGHVSARYIAIPETPLTRIHLIIGRRGGQTPNPDVRELEEAIAELIRTWSDDLLAAAQALPKLGLDRLKIASWSEAFSESYRATYNSERAVRDIVILERISEETPTAILFFRREGDGPGRCSLKIYNQGKPIPLSARVPILEDMGFLAINERTFRVQVPTAVADVYLHDMTLAVASGEDVDVPQHAEALRALFSAVWEGLAETDEFNGLLLAGSIGWRDIAVLRAIARYLRQVGIAYGQALMAETLQRYPKLTRHIVELFHARFDPDLTGDRDDVMNEHRHAITELAGRIESLADDTVIRRFVNIIESMVRTNVYQRDEHGEPVGVFAFKLDPSNIIGLPRPAPFREIWVYSPRVEGVHLRFGAVARGGLRWSDRPQDFRTEILGLVKAQQVKNAVIVPVGAKGGFFPKRLPDRSQRDAFFTEGREAYKVFINNLLSVTDNLDGDTVVHPPRVVRHEGPDPYLVVAADKGTATFSDTANAISEERHFWLDDAFASGGSVGYDHKAMGITARGAWEAVKRHFREMDHDIQTEPFTAIGVGDMSGDVFGNGMLLSEKTCLIAAFDHRDIFIDPKPDPATSYAERERLFALPRSSWQDYDRSLLSPGGGIYSRSAKSIDLSPEARVALDIGAGHLTPLEVLRAILKAPVDLLWFGGIGTYVRAPGETDDDIGDRANDAVRIRADELRVKVVGEGANLGVSHKSRIAFALRGGRINSDAIDNSAGVNTSDVEVNIKIAFAAAMREQKITREERNELLVEMTDEVADLVLRNNYLQTLAISLSKRLNTDNSGYQKRLMEVLGPRGLDRDLEDLPSNIALDERVAMGEGLTRPEIGVLLSYAKITLYDDILSSDVPDDPYLSRELHRYFPTLMWQRFGAEVENHRLRREIIATMLANSMINRGGPTFIIRVGDQTGATIPEIARAFAAARDAYDLIHLNGEIDALDNVIPGDLQLELYAMARHLLLDATVWFARNESFSDGLAAVVRRYGSGLVELRTTFAEILPEVERESVRNRARQLTEAGIAEDTATVLARLPFAIAALEMVVVAGSCGVSHHLAGEVWFALLARMRIADLVRIANSISSEDYYDGLALDRARRTLIDAQRGLATAVLNTQTEGPGTERVEAWIETRRDTIERTQRAIVEVVDSGKVTVARILVAASLLSDLATEVKDAA